MSRDEIFQSGERELKKAFEEVTKRNVLAILEYSKETRVLIRETREAVERLRTEVRELSQELEKLKLSISRLQQKIFSGGSV